MDHSRGGGLYFKPFAGRVKADGGRKAKGFPFSRVRKKVPEDRMRVRRSRGCCRQCDALVLLALSDKLPQD